jgi:hypothetical protein
MTKRLLPIGFYNLQIWNQWIQCGLTWIGVPGLSSISLLSNHWSSDNWPSAPPREDTHDEWTGNPQNAYIACTLRSSERKFHRDCVGVRNVGIIVYGKTLDYRSTTTISEILGIHNIIFSLHMTLNRQNHQASKPSLELIYIWDLVKTTSKSNYCNQQIPYPR